MVMVTKIQKPAKKVARKGDQITDANGAQFSYYRNNIHPSTRSEGRSTGAHAGLINANVVCYSNAIFQCIASCANLGYYDDFLWSPPKEEHRHFKLYYEFKSVISSILGGGMDGIDPHKFIGLYKKRYKDFNANEGKWHGNFIKQ
jgi:ubiquitin C-terminal hydrolase